MTGMECGCITCGDQGLEMTVLEAHGSSGLAVCRGPEGEAIVDVELVGPVAAGDLVLVHAGVALVRLTAAEVIA